MIFRADYTKLLNQRARDLDAQPFKDRIIKMKFRNKDKEVVIAFTMYELLDMRTFANLLMHVNYLDCFNYVREDLSKWHSYVEYSL